MDVRDFCNGLESELTAWKAKLFDVVSRADQLGTAEKEKVWANFNDMKIIIQDLEDKIAQLKHECPSDWSPQKKEIEDAHVDMRGKYNEALDVIGQAAPYSVPG
jgi:hypothetical protein